MKLTTDRLSYKLSTYGHFLAKTISIRPLAHQTNLLLLIKRVLTLRTYMIILSVDYGISFEQMIDAGDYDLKNDDLSVKNFPVNGEGMHWFEFDLVDPKKDITSSDALELLKKDSNPANLWIPAEIEHLCAFGAAFPDLQIKNLLLALGSVAEIGCGRSVPCLGRRGSLRVLSVKQIDYGITSYCRFLRVRKVSAPVASSPSA